jgi:hypothetical protein
MGDWAKPVWRVAALERTLKTAFFCPCAWLTENLVKPAAPANVSERDQVSRLEKWGTALERKLGRNIECGSSRKPPD